MYDHFAEKDALGHVVERRAAGVVALAESHGTEVPGHVSAGADAARETGLVLLLFWVVAGQFFLPLALGWIVWKGGRSAWLGWARLERLHRLIEQEKHEIEHNREQEREELGALYRAKGFEGELLEDVLDVLMADQDRLLKVMLEEELGLALEAYEHPLKQAVGSVVGAAGAFVVGYVLQRLFGAVGMYVATGVTIGVAAAVSALSEKNRLIPALVWNLGIAGLAIGVASIVKGYGA